MRRFLLASLTLLLSAGCATSMTADRRPLFRSPFGPENEPAATAESGRVSDASFARIPEGRMGSVNQLRMQCMTAQDEQVRADQALLRVGKEEKAERAKLSALKARLRAARVERDATGLTGNRARIEAAEEKIRRLEAELPVEQARVGLAESRIREERARLQLAKADVSVREASCEAGKLKALQASAPQDATQYDADLFQAKVFLAKAQANRARQEVKKADQGIREAERQVRSQERIARESQPVEKVPVRGVDEK